MKFPIVELLDRYCIAQVKKEKLGNMAFEEFIFYEEQLQESGIDLQKFKGHIENLINVHRSIWSLEDDFKKNRIDQTPLEEIGRKALQVRDLNARRYQIKERLAVIANEAYKEVKSYGGNKILDFPEYSQSFNYDGIADRIVRVYYPFDTFEERPDGRYKIMEALDKIKFNPGEVLMLEDPFIHSFFPRPLVDYLNDFYENRCTAPMVLVTSNLAWEKNGLRIPVHANLFHEHSTTVTWPRPAVLNSGARPHKVSYTSTKDYPERRFVYKKLCEIGDASALSLMACPGSYDWESAKQKGAFLNNEYSMEFFSECMAAQRLVKTEPVGTSTHFQNLPRQTFLSAYLGIVTETFFVNKTNLIFFSEKVFNAIAHGQIFMYLGPTGSLKELRKFGYYTFDDIIDESYDLVEDDEQRVRQFVKSMQTFLNRPIEQIHQDYLRVWPKIQHNQAHLYSRSFDFKMRAALEMALQSKQ